MTRDTARTKQSRERMRMMDVPFWDYGFGNNRQIGSAIFPLVGTPDPDAVRERVRRLMDWTPRFGQMVEESRGRIRAPFWATDPHFDFDRHFHHVRLDGLGMGEFFERYSRRYEVPLDKRRPLWEVWYYTGVEGGSVLAFKMHHSMYDGLSFVAMSRILSDTPPSIEDARRKLEKASAGSPQAIKPDRSRTTRWTNLVSTAREKLTEIREHGESLWPQPLGDERQISVASLPMGKIRGIQARTGSSLTAIYQTFWSMALEVMHGSMPDELAVSLPMSMRHLTTPTHPLDLDSRQTSTPLAIPFHISDPVRRLGVVHERLNEVKNLRESIYRSALIAERLPRQVLHRAVLAKIKLTNMISSSVPGPKKPLTVLGEQITDLFLHTGPVPHNPLAVVFTSYADRLSVVLTADPILVPWVAKMPTEAATALDALDAATS